MSPVTPKVSGSKKIRNISDEVLGIMAHNGVRNINTFPPTEPQFPTQIHVFAIHEENALVEAAQFFEGFSPNQYCSTCTPCCCAGLGIVDFRVLSRLLA